MRRMLGVFGPGNCAGVLDDILRRMRARGVELPARRIAHCAAIAVGHGGTPGAMELPEIAQHDGVLAMTDAALYYREDLQRELVAAGELPLSPATPHLLLAAYRAWGAECASHLEGDFAFVLWDARMRTLVCSRDFVGTRPLYHGEFDDAVVVGSCAADVALHPRCGEALDIAAIGASVAGLFNAGGNPGFAGVAPVPVGHTLVRRDSGRVRIARHWSPPEYTTTTQTFDDAAAELRELLKRAVAERLDQNAATAVWLSGGWDSSAVFAAGQSWLADFGATCGDSPPGDRLRPVSMSHPVGDAGREDEMIETIAGRYSAHVTWQSITDVPLLGDRPEHGAGSRDTVFAHAFESWNRAMARRTLTMERGGARVALTGVGGDELFSNSTVYLADLLRRGQWFTLARDWYQQRGRTLDGFGRLVLKNALPPWARRAVNGAAGRDVVAGYYECAMPPWMHAGFVRDHGLELRERDAAPVPPPGGMAAAEMPWLLTGTMFARIRGILATIVADEGVELRHPLLDSRIVRFAATRPREERASGGETKRLLRGAMRGLLPSSVLAPRGERTGVLGPYLLNELRGAARERVSAAFASPVLAELGIVNATELRTAWERFQTGGSSMNALRLLETYQAELWVRARTLNLMPDVQDRSVSSAQKTVSRAKPITATRVVIPLGEGLSASPHFTEGT